MNNQLLANISMLFPDQPVVTKTKIVADGDTVAVYDGGSLPKEASLYWYAREYGRATLEAVKSYSAEDWISERGFGPVRLVTLLDLEAKLRSVNATAPKLAETRQWLDGITLAFAASPTPRLDWPEEPWSFELVVQEAMGMLLAAA